MNRVDISQSCVEDLCLGDCEILLGTGVEKVLKSEETGGKPGQIRPSRPFPAEAR